MDALAAEQLDDLLAELAQTDAIACDLGMRLHQPEDVPPDRLCVHAEQQIRR